MSQSMEHVSCVCAKELCIEDDIVVSYTYGSAYIRILLK